MKRSLLVFGVLALAGCPPKTADPAQAQQRCSDAAAATVKVVVTGEIDVDTQGNYRAVIANRCVEDKWSELAIECTRNANTSDTLRSCWYKHLSQEQQDKVTKAAASMGSAPVGVEGAALGVTAIDPPTGPAAGNTRVVLKGARFLSEGPRKIKVFFGEKEAPSVKVETDTSISAQTPAGKAGDVVNVRVQFDPGGEIVLPKAFTYE